MAQNGRKYIFVVVVVVISESNIGVTNLVDSWNIYYLKQDPNIRRKAVQN